MIIMSILVSVLCLPLPSLHAFDFYEIFLLLVGFLDIGTCTVTMVDIILILAVSFPKSSQEVLTCVKLT